MFAGWMWVKMDLKPAEKRFEKDKRLLYFFAYFPSNRFNNIWVQFCCAVSKKCSNFFETARYKVNSTILFEDQSSFCMVKSLLL